MRTDIAPVVRLQDYRVPDFLVERVDLDFNLHETATRVRSMLRLKRNPASFDVTPLVLEGDELALLTIQIDGRSLKPDEYTVAPDKLVVPSPPLGAFTLTVETLVNPSANSKLMGLYRSGGNYCTQCEAEGFRRITYFPDRPDVMAIYTVRVEADKSEAPVLLSNGNPGIAGDVPGTNRHFAIWDDPHPKPSYLFALVAGDLGWIEDEFTTRSGRKVKLNIYVEKGKEERAHYAMDSLKRSMRWDEEVFGCEYDLDVFNIVAVSDFNMGAMENKGLNVFNDRYVLASADTATDADYHNIEAIVAHEYFHNWTGNRVTCRDWFQLCLKEGLTVFRDQEFSSDMRSRPVERISAVRTLRAAQFVEDAGPLAHPVRPASYKEINNFYTATVYNKGAEVIRMLRTLIGRAAFRKGMDLYLSRHDGAAATIEEFIACFTEDGARNLDAFMRWYNQAGTPSVKVTEHFDVATGTLRLDFEQNVPPTPGQPSKEPMVIPILMGAIGEDGQELITNRVLVFETEKASRTFTGLASRPILSLFRGFSAPVRLDFPIADSDLLRLASHDRDPFNRWEALQTYAMNLLKRSVAAVRRGDEPLVDDAFCAALDGILARGLDDPAFTDLLLTLPSESDVAREIASDVDPEAIAIAVDALADSLGRACLVTALDIYNQLNVSTAFSPDAASAGRRALKATSLGLIARGDRAHGATLALAQYKSATTMTDRLAALRVLNRTGGPEREEAFNAFELAYSGDALILDNWFTLNATERSPGALDRVRSLMGHPTFSIANPNRVRALIGAFANGNPRQFHRADGASYDFVAHVIHDLDGRNPQVAARLATAFRTFQTLEPSRRALARKALVFLQEQVGLSRDLRDIVDRALS